MQLQFLSDTFQFETEAMVMECGEDDDGSYVVTDCTVFYPGGGGQEPDKGEIVNKAGEHFSILDVDYSDGRLKHYISGEIAEKENVKILIEPDYRLQNAQLHTAGHLLSSVIYEKLNWPLLPVKGFHYQQGAYIEFEPEREIDEFSETIIYEAMKEDMEKKLPVHVRMAGLEEWDEDKIYDPDNFSIQKEETARWVSIEGYKAIPCDGTHLHHVGEIDNFIIKQILYKKGKFRINYSVGEEDLV